MSILSKLFGLTSDLRSSASSEGCEEELTVVGSIELTALLQEVTGLKALYETAQVVESVEVSRICERLQNRAEPAVESANLNVADDAVKLIQRLANELCVAQTALSQALQTASKSGQFVNQVAGLSIWEHDKNDGTPYEECEPSDEGYLDSHTALMNLVEQARIVQEGK